MNYFGHQWQIREASRISSNNLQNSQDSDTLHHVDHIWNGDSSVRANLDHQHPDGSVPGLPHHPVHHDHLHLQHLGLHDHDHVPHPVCPLHTSSPHCTQWKTGDLPKLASTIQTSTVHHWSSSRTLITEKSGISSKWISSQWHPSLEIISDNNHREHIRNKCLQVGFTYRQKLTVSLFNTSVLFIIGFLSLQYLHSTMGQPSPACSHPRSYQRCGSILDFKVM